ncbi:unnamed protein product [Linum tenue]|uniref:S-protein homolog n=1 Tax=Linum tenue TaxID=586396 RepID=A0AAV0NKH4_9ROSI|nr:unnamed protein product [Linum tenue]
MGRGSSSIVISKVIILGTIIANLLLSATTVASFSFWPYHYVHVTNELTGGKVLLVHCKSGTRDLGVQNISPAKDLTWRFRPGFLVVATLYWCYIAPDDSHHIHFDAWSNDVAGKYEGSSSGVISTVTILSTILAKLLLSATTVTAFSFWPYHYVHVTNQLTGGKVLLVHCKSGTRDLGVLAINPANEFNWRFRPWNLYVSTLYWCYIAPRRQPPHLFRCMDG